MPTRKRQFSEAQKRAVYTWRKRNPEKYILVQRMYNKRCYQYKKFWATHGHLGDPSLWDA